MKDGIRAALPARFSNPIAEGADPWITFHEGRYYWCLSAAGKGVFVFSSDRPNALGERHLVWQAPAEGPYRDQVWAPELHRIDDAWYIYTTASDGNNATHRVIVLECREKIPTGGFHFKAQLYTGDSVGDQALNRWAIDATPLRWRGRLYLVWSGWEAEADEQWLYLAPMANPWTVAGNRVRLCDNDDHLWERVDESVNGRGLNEAPQVLEHAGRVFIVFSASGSWQPSYKLGLLELTGSDPLRPGDWTKHPQPVFVSSEQTWGVGHGSFTRSPDGTENWMVYHAKETKEHDWLRSIFAQQFSFSADGFPVFGQPVRRGESLTLPAAVAAKVWAGDFREDFRAGWAAWDYYGHQDLISSNHAGLRLGDFGSHLAMFRSGEKLLVREREWQTCRIRVEYSKPGDSDFGLLFAVRNPRLGFDGQEGFGVGVSGGELCVLEWRDGLKHERFARQFIAPETETQVIDLQLTERAIRIRLPTACDIPWTIEAGQVGLRLAGGRVVVSRFTVTAMAT